MRKVGSLILLTLLWAGVLSADSAPPEARVLRVVFSMESFTNVNRNDALASAKAWIESVGRRRGLKLGVEVDTYETVEELRTIVQEGRADLFIVNSIHYLALETEAHWDPKFIPQKGDSPQRDYVLLARADRGPSLTDFAGNRVIFLLTMGARLGSLWLDTELDGRGLPPSNMFFEESNEVAKPASAVLPVFFGKADACVVDRSSFEIMQELNPQIGSVLDVVASSPPYVETVICIHKEYQQHRNDLLDGLTELHDDPAGQSLLTVFKIDKLVAYDDEMMTSIRALTVEGRKLARGTAQ